MSFHSRSVANGLNGVLGMQDEMKVGAVVSRYIAPCYAECRCKVVVMYVPFWRGSRHSKVISKVYGSPNLAGLFMTLMPSKLTTDILAVDEVEYIW